MTKKKNTSIFLRANNAEIRERLEQEGFKLCHCARYVDAIWLHWGTFNPSYIHGEGYTGAEFGNATSEEIIEFDLRELRTSKSDVFITSDVDTFINKIKEYGMVDENQVQVT